MTHYKGSVGTSLLIERKPSKKKKTKIKYSSHQCLRCNNKDSKYVKVIDGEYYCLKCFIDNSQKVKMVARY